MSAPASKRVKYLNVEISEKGLSEFSGNRRVVFIAKEDVQKIAVKFGSCAERPMLQMIAGALLTCLGAAGLAMIMASGMRGVRWGSGWLIFGGFGVWLLYETIKKSHFLIVTSPKETRKLVFRGKFIETEFFQFTTNASELGYQFDSSTHLGSK